MIKVNFNKKTGEILGFYPNDIAYTKIPEPFIEISIEKWKKCLDKKFRVDIKTLKLEELEQTQEEIDLNNQMQINTEAKQFLYSTDWKVIRHRDQLDMSIKTSLEEKEYMELLKQRQEAREKVIEE